MTTSALLVRPAILSPALILRFVSIVGSAVSFYLPLAVLPLFADAAGAHASAGLATGAPARGALTAALLRDARRGEGLAIVGVASGIPAVLALPLGVWAAGRFGFAPVFVVTALAPLVALVTRPGLPARPSAGASP